MTVWNPAVKACPRVNSPDLDDAGLITETLDKRDGSRKKGNIWTMEAVQ